MAVCLNCGKEAGWCLCDGCRASIELEDLCRRITEYRPGSGGNPLWDDAAMRMSTPGNFRNVVFALADSLPSPRRNYWKILSFAGTGPNIQKYQRPWLYQIYAEIEADGNLTRLERNRIKGILLGALFMDYRYQEAERLAGELLEEEELPVQAYYNLADFYTKTRRYDEADDVIRTAGKLCSGEDPSALFGKIREDISKYREKEAQGKQQYMPNPSEHREEARAAYMEFLQSIGIDCGTSDLTPRARNNGYPDPIPRDQYPDPRESRDADFDTFVAYDLETTGINTKIDAIIEIGAIKVCGGKLVESEEFLFQRYVRPFKRGLKEEITALTGITREDVKDAGEMWEVFPEFMKFAGDSVLVGFNNVKFDSRFLVRAGRYSHLPMNNPQFDVMKYADGFRERLGITDRKVSLDVLCRKLGIENPEAHRALPDAVTTAKIYLRLKEMDTSEKSVALDDLLSDLDNW